MTTSTTTVPTKPTETKGPGLLAIEALQSQVNDLISEVRTLRSEIGIVHGLLESFRTQLQSAPARAISTDVSQIPNSVTFRATQLILTFDDKGSPAYKVKGGRFSTWGVRVWPEVLPVLGIDPARLKPGPNVIDLNVVAEIAEKIDEETGESKTVAKKVIGLAMA